MTAALLASGCATTRPQTLPLAGAWSNGRGAVWTIEPNGSYHADIDQDGHRDSWGTLRVRGADVMIRGTGGLQPKGCRSTGRYRYTLAADTLTFELISDPCGARRKNLLLTWHRK